MLSGQLLLGSAMIVVSVIVHVAGLVIRARWASRFAERRDHHLSTTETTAMLVTTVLVVVLIHSVEIWCWAALYVYLGEFASMQTAVYFSAVTATTLGYGDITLTERWQLLSTIEAMGGLILFGVSTAFVIAMMRQLFDRRQGSPRG